MVVKNDHGADGRSGWFRWISKPVHAAKKMVRSSLAVVKEHRRAYLILNLGYYGLIAAAVCCTMSSIAGRRSRAQNAFSRLVIPA